MREEKVEIKPIILFDGSIFSKFEVTLTIQIPPIYIFSGRVSSVPD